MHCILVYVDVFQDIFTYSDSCIHVCHVEKLRINFGLIAL